MKDLTLFILSHLVTHPEDISVSETEGENSSTKLEVSVNKEDMGRVIGKEGKIIRAIRDVIKIRALKENRYVDIILSE